MKKIGVFICHCEYHNSLPEIDLCALVAEVERLPRVAYAVSLKDVCSGPGKEMIKEAISKYSLDGVVITSCLPAVHEQGIRDILHSAGMSPQQYAVSTLFGDDNGHHSRDKEKMVLKAREHLEEVISNLVTKDPRPAPAQPIVKKALVIGGGVSGIHAALDIANGGYEVYLVERTPSIGGNMVRLSEVFPTLDCPQCILTPKMVQCGQHPSIHILAYSEVQEVRGQAGNFEVLVKRKGTSIDWNKCTGCGDCANVCPVEMYSDFQRGMAPRKATYKPFAQAVPNKFVIDKAGMSPCRIACPLHLNSHGYVQLIKAGKFREALSLIRETLPFPGIIGRICDHPCERVCKRAEVDSPVPICALKRFAAESGEGEEAEIDLTVGEEKGKKVAVIGAGPAGLMAAYDLRKKGYAVTVFESREKPGGLLTHGFPSYRLPRELVEQEIALIAKMGVEYRFKTKMGSEVTLSDLRKDYDAVFIAVGAVGCSTLLSPQDTVRLPVTRGGTLAVNIHTLATAVEGIFAGGDAVTGPNTAIEALAAGRKAATSIDRYLSGEDLHRGGMEPSLTPCGEFDLSKKLINYDYLKTEQAAITTPKYDITGEPGTAVTVQERREDREPFSMIMPEEPVLTAEEAVAEASRCLNCAGCCECMSCVTACEAGAIDHSLTDSYETIAVGAIVVATGYELLARDLIGEYEQDPDILDPLQFERLLCPSGPTDGVVVRPSDRKVPKEVVFVECVGSRDPEHHLPYCSRVCCMYSCKMGMLYKHAVHDGTMYVFYMDVRTDGKMYEEFYQRGTEEDGLVYIRGRISKMFRDGDKIMVWGADTLTGKQVEIAADMVVLAMAMIPRPDAKELAKILGIETDEFGFMKVLHPRLRPSESPVPGIFLAGCCQSPKDIPECVAQSCGCAGKVLSLFSQDEMAVSLPRGKVVEV
jgi:heterodisulfide reductase subunit A-like polyferredoxin